MIHAEYADGTDERTPDRCITLSTVDAGSAVEYRTLWNIRRCVQQELFNIFFKHWNIR